MYFSYCRDRYKQREETSHRDGHARLQEARAHAEQQWQAQEKKLPKLTEEQREQMARYVRIVQAHGMTKIAELQESQDCVGCPVLSMSGKINKRSKQNMTLATATKQEQ